MSVWTEERVAIAHRLYIVEGQSASVVAQKLDCGITRNAVVGKAHRMGWMKDHRCKPSLAAMTTYRPAVKVKRTPPKPGPQNRPGAVFGAVVVTNVEAAAKRRQAAKTRGDAAMANLAAPANDNALPLIDRSRFQCAWPVDVPARPAEQLCCGSPVMEGGNRAVPAYCAFHARQALSKQAVTAPRDAKKYERSLRRWAA